MIEKCPGMIAETATIFAIIPGQRFDVRADEVSGKLGRYVNVSVHWAN